MVKNWTRRPCASPAGGRTFFSSAEGGKGKDSPGRDRRALRSRFLPQKSIMYYSRRSHDREQGKRMGDQESISLGVHGPSFPEGLFDEQDLSVHPLGTRSGTYRREELLAS